MGGMSKSVVVLGAGMGGLSAAIHARLRGYDVLVIEAREVVGGKAAGIEESGYRLDPGPSIVILTRLYEQVFLRAGRKMEDYLQFQRLDPFSRVLFEGAPPIDLPANIDDCLAVLKEVAPDDTDSFQRLLDTLDQVSPLIDRSIFSRPYDKPYQLADPNLIRTALKFDVRSTYKDLVDGMFKSSLLRAFFYGFPSYGGQTYDSKAPGAMMIPYLMVREGVWWPVGGISAIPRAFEALARDLGVEFKTGVRVQSFDQVNKRIQAVRTSDGDVLEADAFISNIDKLTTRAMLGKQVDWRPSLSYFTVHWGVKRRIPGLSHHTLLVPKSFEAGFTHLYRERRFPVPPITYINATVPVDPTTAPPDCENVFAVITTPAREDSFDWTVEAPGFRDVVKTQLASFGVGFDESEIEFERVQTPVLFEERDGSYRGSLYGPDEAHRLWGLMPLSNVDPDFGNLFYAGGSVQPGAGLPMVTLSGKFAAGKLP
jgi:phytoene desaturase